MFVYDPTQMQCRQVVSAYLKPSGFWRSIVALNICWSVYMRPFGISIDTFKTFRRGIKVLHLPKNTEILIKLF